MLLSDAVPGKLPAFCDKELMMGIKIPPALAVVEGIAGAIRASANPNPYARPSVLLPKALTNRVATLSPSPVFSNPCRQRVVFSTHIPSHKWGTFPMLVLQTVSYVLKECFCCMQTSMFAAS